MYWAQGHKSKTLDNRNKWTQQMYFYVSKGILITKMAVSQLLSLMDVQWRSNRRLWQDVNVKWYLWNQLCLS